MTPVHLSVPHLQQRLPGECLAACAEMILTYLAILIPYERLLELLQVRSGFGTPAANVRYLEKLELEIIYQQGDFNELYDHLRQGRPCIAFIKTGELSYWHEAIDHAVVVVGMDDRYIYINDPAFVTAPIQVERDEFDLAWLDWGEKYAVFIQQG
jgi:ABC-type bacteriocin/lantibiotic exporter with double-glycine peptidase domain